MAVHDDIDLVLLEHAQVHLALYGDRGFEPYVRQFRSDHGTAPSIRKGAPRGLEQDVLIILIHTNGGAVHEFDNFAIDAPGKYSQLAPDFLARCGSPLREVQFAFLLPEHAHAALAHFEGYILDGTLADLDIQVGRHLEQFDAVLDFIVRSLALGRHYQGFGNRPTVIGVGRGSPGNHAGEVAGHDGVHGRATNAPALVGLLGIDSAGPPVTDAAAASSLSEGASFLLLYAIEGGLLAIPRRFFQHLPRGLTCCKFLAFCHIDSS